MVWNPEKGYFLKEALKVVDLEIIIKDIYKIFIFSNKLDTSNLYQIHKICLIRVKRILNHSLKAI